MKRFGWIAVCLLLMAVVPFVQSCSDDDDDDMNQEQEQTEAPMTEAQKKLLQQMQGKWKLTKVIIDGEEERIGNVHVLIDSNRCITYYVFDESVATAMECDYDEMKADGDRFVILPTTDTVEVSITLEADGTLKAVVKNQIQIYTRYDFSFPDAETIKTVDSMQGDWEVDYAELYDINGNVTASTKYPNDKGDAIYMNIKGDRCVLYNILNGNKLVASDTNSVIFIKEFTGLDKKPILFGYFDFYGAESHIDIADKSHISLFTSDVERELVLKRKSFTVPEYSPQAAADLLQGKWVRRSELRRKADEGYSIASFYDESNTIEIDGNKAVCYGKNEMGENIMNEYNVEVQSDGTLKLVCEGLPDRKVCLRSDGRMSVIYSSDKMEYTDSYIMIDLK